MFNYYSVYDYDLNRVGLFEHSTSKGNTDDTDPTPRDDPIDDDKGNPAEDESSKFPVWVIILLVVVILGVLIALGGYMFIKYRNRKLAGNLEQYNQLESSNTAV